MRSVWAVWNVVCCRRRFSFQKGNTWCKWKCDYLIFCDYYTQHLWYPGLCISLGSWICLKDTAQVYWSNREIKTVVYLISFVCHAQKHRKTLSLTTKTDLYSPVVCTAYVAKMIHLFAKGLLWQNLLCSKQNFKENSRLNAI